MRCRKNDNIFKDDEQIVFMDLKETLIELGLSEGQVRVYLVLLKYGESKVNKIKQETKMHRTTIYDFLDALVKKGLASYVVKNNVKFYRAAHPGKLRDIIKEKEEKLKMSMNAFIKLGELEKKSLKVDVYEGREGFKTMMNKVLREGREFLSFGVEEVKFEEMFPHLMKMFFKKEKELRINERIITQKGATFVYSYPHLAYRYLDKKFFSPTYTAIFGNNVAFIIWEPLTMIVIENKDLANAYKKHFELLWRIADKKP